MGKVIRLTESQLKDVIKKIISEQAVKPGQKPIPYQKSTPTPRFNPFPTSGTGYGGRPTSGTGTRPTSGTGPGGKPTAIKGGNTSNLSTTLFDMTKNGNKPWDINLYSDINNTKQVKKYLIGLIIKSSTGKILFFRPNEREQADYVYDCTKQILQGQGSDLRGNFYNITLSDWFITNKICAKNSKNVNVPQATFVSNKSNNPQSIA